MITRKGRREPGLADVQSSLDDVATYEDLSGEALPRLARALGCQGFTLHRSTADTPFLVAGTNMPGPLAEYADDWFTKDPLNGELMRPGIDRIIPFSRLPGWPRMARHPLYAEFAPSHRLTSLLWMNLGDVPYLRPGATSLFLLRTRGQRAFDGDDVCALAQLLPALRAAGRRCARVALSGALVPLLEAILDDATTGARLALDAGGRIVWMSRDAEKLLAPCLGPRRALPEALLALARGAPAKPARFLVAPGVRVRAEPRSVAGAALGFTVIDLRLDDRDSETRVLRARFELTAAEAEVLLELAAGRSNAEIAARRRVSLTTVRTQVARLLDKLGVHTRLEAALIAIQATARR